MTKKAVKKAVSKNYIVKGFFVMDSYNKKPYFTDDAYDSESSPAIAVEITIPKTLFPKPVKTKATVQVLLAA